MSKKLQAINYTSRDFASIRRDLENFTKRYYSNSFKDFNQAGFGSLMLDTVAYIGDILSFYLDYQVNESFLDSALEYNNVVVFQYSDTTLLLYSNTRIQQYCCILILEYRNTVVL